MIDMGIIDPLAWPGGAAKRCVGRRPAAHDQLPGRRGEDPMGRQRCAHDGVRIPGRGHPAALSRRQHAAVAGPRVRRSVDPASSSTRTSAAPLSQHGGAHGAPISPRMKGVDLAELCSTLTHTCGSEFDYTTEHVSYVVAGRLRVTDAGGSEGEVRPDDVPDFTAWWSATSLRSSSSSRHGQLRQAWLMAAELGLSVAVGPRHVRCRDRRGGSTTCPIRRALP